MLQNYTAGPDIEGVHSAMDLNTSTLWWLVAGALVAAELLTGTFYLLMLAIGAAAGALTAHLHLGMTAQLLAPLPSSAGIAGWYHRRQHPTAAPRKPTRRESRHRPIGLKVEAWQDGRLAFSTAAPAGKPASSGAAHRPHLVATTIRAGLAGLPDR